MKKSILLSATVLAMTLTLTTSCKKREDCSVFFENERAYFESQGVKGSAYLNQYQLEEYEPLKQDIDDCYARNGEIRGLGVIKWFR